MCGFSAGGHLTAALSTLWKDPVITQAGLVPEEVRPDAAILGYAVMSEAGGKTLRSRLVEGSFAPETSDRASNLPQYVTEDNPPTFLWHTATDQTVPVANSLLMTQALYEHHVPVELHVFPRGQHGLALATEWTMNGNPDMVLPVVARWVDLCCDWLKRTLPDA